MSFGHCITVLYVMVSDSIMSFDCLAGCLQDVRASAFVPEVSVSETTQTDLVWSERRGIAKPRYSRRVKPQQESSGE